MRLFRLCFLLLAVPSTAALLVNHTIDDRYGDSSTGTIPTYLPQEDWANGEVCQTCNIYPANLGHIPADSLNGTGVDPAQTFNGTWHDTTYFPDLSPRNITVQFAGQAVYVFNIIANVVLFTETTTTLFFSLDGEAVGHYAHSADLFSPQVMYNVVVYANQSLPHGNHTLVISAEGTDPSLVLFDYVVYTADDLASALPPVPTTTSVQTSSHPTTVQPSSHPTVVQTYPITATSVLPGTSPRSPFVSATSPPPHHRNSAIIIGITAAGSILGTILFGVVAILVRRKCNRRAHKKQGPHCSSPHPTRPGVVSDPTVPPPLRAYATQPPSPSDGFSRAATRPDSRRARSLSDLKQGLGYPSTSLPPIDRHSARVRLFAKIVARSRPRDPSPVGTRVRTASVPAITARSSVAGNREQTGRGHTDGLEHAGLRRAPTGIGGRLRAEVAGLREEIELFRETELAIYRIPGWVPPPYQQGQGVVPGTVETQPTLVAGTVSAIFTCRCTTRINLPRYSLEWWSRYRHQVSRPTGVCVIGQTLGADSSHSQFFTPTPTREHLQDNLHFASI